MFLTATPNSGTPRGGCAKHVAATSPVQQASDICINHIRNDQSMQDDQSSPLHDKLLRQLGNLERLSSDPVQRHEWCGHRSCHPSVLMMEASEPRD